MDMGAQKGRVKGKRVTSPSRRIRREGWRARRLVRVQPPPLLTKSFAIAVQRCLATTGGGRGGKVRQGRRGGSMMSGGDNYQYERGRGDCAEEERRREM